MGKIYTKKGDCGTTGVIDGRRISKADGLAEVLGTVDELNSVIGVCRFEILNSKSKDPNKFKIQNELKKIQNNLMTINAILAGSSMLKLRSSETTHLEKLIDKLQEELPKLNNFIYPVGYLQLARSVARRAERAVVLYINSKFEIISSKEIQKYMNRLSDALFVMARWVNLQEGISDEEWKINR